MAGIQVEGLAKSYGDVAAVRAATEGGDRGEGPGRGNAFNIGHMLVASGQYDRVLVVGGEKMPKGFIQTSGVEDEADQEYLRQLAVGMPGPAFWGFLARRRMHDHGTTEEQLARVRAHDLVLTEAEPLFDAADVARLQRIMSLRQLGFALEEVGACLSRADFSPLEVVRLHVERLREQIELQRKLCARLEALAEHFRAAEEVSADEFLRTIEVMTMVENYYTPEQLEYLKKRREELGEAAIQQGQADWARLFDDYRVEMEKGTDPASETVQALARRWRELLREFTGTEDIGDIVIVRREDRDVRLRVAGFGINHQSNGRGGPESRSWNRIMGQLGFEIGDATTVMLRPWWRMPESARNDENPDIDDFMGDGDLRVVHHDDERHLAVAYNDIDFCLRVREAGLRVIYTPHARLLHHHSASRGSDIRIERLASFTWEREYMRTRWAHVLFDDPFFNPNLSLSGKRGRLATAPRPRIYKKG